MVAAAGDSSGFYRSDDAGESWRRLSDWAPGDPQYYQELQPGPAAPLFVPTPAPEDSAADASRSGPRSPPPQEDGPYSMCNAVSTGAHPLGSYHRYEFLRPLFPDYPRAAIWPDGYYVPTSTGDDVVQKHACVVDRRRLLAGEPATEQCFVVDDVNSLNNAYVDGPRPPPDGAPNVVMETGGTQLQGDFDDDAIYAWQFHVDWATPVNSRRRRRPTPCAGRTTPRPPSTRPTTARSGTWATTSRRAQSAIRLALARSACRGVPRVRGEPAPTVLSCRLPQPVLSGEASPAYARRPARRKGR